MKLGMEDFLKYSKNNGDATLYMPLISVAQEAWRLSQSLASKLPLTNFYFEICKKNHRAKTECI